MTATSGLTEVESEALLSLDSTSSLSAAEQEEIRIITENLQELISRLDFLPSVRGIAADLRVTLLSGVLTTVTTVTTVSTVTTVATLTNQTNIGGWAATQQIPSIVNQTAILSNLNNVVVS